MDVINRIETSLTLWLLEQVVGLVRLVSTLLLSTPAALLNAPAFLRIYRQVEGIAIAGVAPVIIWVATRKVYGADSDEEVTRAMVRAVCVPIVVTLLPRLIAGW